MRRGPATPLTLSRRAHGSDRAGSREEVREALFEASEGGTRVSIVGGRTHGDKGNPCEVDMELSTSGLDRVIAYDPARCWRSSRGDADRRPSTCPRRRRAGMARRCLRRRDRRRDDRDRASSPRRLRMGALRDTVVEIELVTGDGRLFGAARGRSRASQARRPPARDGVPRNARHDIQVAVKVRPFPKARRVMRMSDGGLLAGRKILDAVPLPSPSSRHPSRPRSRSKDGPRRSSRDGGGERRRRKRGTPRGRWRSGSEAVAGTIVVEVVVPPSKLEAVLDGETDWRR